MGKYDDFSTSLNRAFRNLLNVFKDDVDSRIGTQKSRVDDLIKGTPQPSEVVDSRGGFPVLRDRLDSVDAHLADKAKQTSGYIALSSYCVGDGITDDTAGFLNAVSYAKTNKKSIYVDGAFLIKQGIIIENNTIPEFFGSSRTNAILLFDISSGFAIEAKTYYNRPLKLTNLSIKLKDTTKIASGLKVNFGSWGGCVIAENVSIKGFTDIVLNTVEVFTSKFNNCELEGGGVKVAKILKIDKGSTFSNVNIFDNCVFSNGKIGVQNLGGIKYVYRGCTFSGLALFMHNPLITGVDQRNDFLTCWYESIDKGILNASIDESTLTPIVPVVNKSDLTNTVFSNNNQAFTPTYILDANIEPGDYSSSQFFFTNGWRATIQSKKPTFTDVELLNGWTGELKRFKAENNVVTLYGKLKPGTQSALSQIAVLPNTLKPYTTVVITLGDSPNGNSANRLYLASNGTLTVPSDQANVFNSSYVYNFQIMYLCNPS